MLTRKTVVLAKIETAYGTDPVPTASTDAIAVQDLEIRPTGDLVERNGLKNSLSPLGILQGAKRVDLSFKTEAKGTGAPGVPPVRGWEGVLFRACGMSETVNADTNIVYAPVSAGFESCTLYVYRDRLFHKVTGCRGSFRIAAEAGKPVMVEWKLKGCYLSPTDAASSVPVFGGLLPPIAAGAGFTVGDYSPVTEKLEIDINNTLAERKNIAAQNGIAGFEITARKPRGSFEPEAVAEATHPFWNNWENGTPLALSLTVGTAAGNRFRIEAPALQYSEIDYADRDGRAVYRVPFLLAMNDGDDELTITMM